MTCGSMGEPKAAVAMKQLTFRPSSGDSSEQSVNTGTSAVVVTWLFVVR